jgi:hypothetical protein
MAQDWGWATHALEGFGSVEVGGYAGIDKMVAIAAFLRERGQGRG